MTKNYLIEKAINYIEHNLKQPLLLEQIASIANYSPWHFHRIFYAATGITIGEYIRKRRLSEAAAQLLGTNTPIKQIAGEFRFESQAAFTRSFKSYTGYTPGCFRKSKIAILPYPAMNTLRYKGEIMNPTKIVFKESFKVVGLSCRTTTNNNQIPSLWDKFNAVCKSIPDYETAGCALGVCYYEEMPEMTGDTPFTYMAGIEVKSDASLPKDMEMRSVPAAEYAVFEHHGSLETLGKTYSAIYENWLESSNYQRANSDDFELYDERFDYGKENSIMEIWIPVIKK